MSRNLRPAPPDFRERATGKSRRAMERHYEANWRIVDRWFTEAGIIPSRARPDVTQAKRPVPDDFADVAPTMPILRLQAHYGVGENVVRRWEAETGIKAQRLRSAPGEGKRHRAKLAAVRGRYVAPVTPRQAAPLAGREEEAAQYLRRRDFVFRCGDKGGADAGGKFWRFGNVVLTGAELIGRAQRHGWNPDEWRQIAGQAAA
jgi:hypothetical protein